MGQAGPMNSGVAAYDLAPLLAIAGIGIALALGPLVWFWRRGGGATPAARLRALALLTLFLSFDLVVLGAFTRLTDSGLGCPDWPGCYGHASPLGASERIASAQAAVPTGPVTRGKAWIEMAHRYSATAIGVLVVALAAWAMVEMRRRRVLATPLWAVVTVLWVAAQGAFGALTVTMNLYPGIVTLHLLGGLGLVALLAVQAEVYEPRPLPLSRALRTGVVAVASLALVQVALGGWVSTNYAVLACREFPTCQGSWWPDMNFGDAFALRRPLGASAEGGYLPFPALTAIHMAHRIGALVAVPALAWLGWRLGAAGPGARRWGLALIAVAAWQAASGLTNVLLDWPLAAALAHTAGSAALAAVLSVVLVRSSPAAPTGPAAGPAVPARRPS
jgi:cytochrome c oxidase assembly protein subunit 15